MVADDTFAVDDAMVVAAAVETVVDDVEVMMGHIHCYFPLPNKLKPFLVLNDKNCLYKVLMKHVVVS